MKPSLIKSDIDAYFAKKAMDASITEWYSVADMKDMTTTAVYTLFPTSRYPRSTL